MLTEPFNATKPETFVVLYGRTQNGLTRTSTSMVIATATSQTYSIQLNSLDIGTQYYFQVQSRNRFGSVVSNVMDFTTDDASKLSKEFYSLVKLYQDNYYYNYYILYKVNYLTFHYIFCSVWTCE